jgi:hypothetical protein
MKQIIFFTITCLIVVSCKLNNSNFDAQKIIDKSIIASGSDKISSSTLKFDFREYNYKAIRNNGMFSLERNFYKDSVFYRDVLSNRGFQRFMNNNPVTISEINSKNFSESINSVHYFSILPYGLNDKAVKKDFLGIVNIKGENYFKIKVSFTKDGGGIDYDDVFIYWIHQADYLIDYLAYSYKSNGGGIRFRDIKNSKIVKGVRFLNYNNYKPKRSIKLENIDTEYLNNQLIKISEIEIENIYLLLDN